MAGQEEGKMTTRRVNAKVTMMISEWGIETLPKRLLRSAKLLHLWDGLTDAEFQRVLKRLAKQNGGKLPSLETLRKKR